jgi:hypothetical protein
LIDGKEGVVIVELGRRHSVSAESKKN